jgi:hypothetical protein
MKTFWIAILLFAVTLNVVPQERIKPEGEMPIVAWVGVPAAETSLERFKELKEAGININFNWYPNIESVEKALDLAQKAGIKIMPSCPELKTEPEKTAKRLMNHPALSGYHLRDEPSAADFPELGEWAKKIQSVDNKHYCYINLFPCMVDKRRLGTDTYLEHLEALTKLVPVSFISFDHYPVKEDKDGKCNLNEEWYQNLEEVAAFSKKAGLPFWAFSLAVAHADYPVPAVGEIKLQLFSDLAYGAQVLQYFTYWNPGYDPVYDFHHAPIGLDGKRTDVYDRIKSINQEIHALSGVFLDAKMLSVWHTGKRIPDHTRRINKLPAPVSVLETSDGGAVVSLLEKKDRRFLVIVNRDYKQPMRLTIVTADSVKKVLKDGSLVPASAYANTMEVDPGDMAIYTWEEK